MTERLVMGGGVSGYRGGAHVQRTDGGYGMLGEKGRRIYIWTMGRKREKLDLKFKSLVYASTSAPRNISL